MFIIQKRESLNKKRLAYRKSFRCFGFADELRCFGVCLFNAVVKLPILTLFSIFGFGWCLYNMILKHKQYKSKDSLRFGGLEGVCLT